jgi:hypothetical protein
VSNRKRNTIIKVKKDCQFEYLLSHKAVSRGAEEKHFIGTAKCLIHTHAIHLNPFSFKVHEKSITEYQVLMTQAKKYRFGKITYAESQELLKQEQQGLVLGNKTYYNLLRKKPGDSSNPDTITSLLKVLDDLGFIYRTRQSGVSKAASNRLFSRGLYSLCSALYRRQSPSN